MKGESILLVDDEELVLSSYHRVFRKQFRVELACGGEQALASIAALGPFAVVVSDMRMPGMNGIELLQRVKAISPETSRLMLTGNSDMQTAIDAVNQGSVFRFLTKPCSPDDLRISIATGIEQYCLARAGKGPEYRRLLVKTETLAENMLLDEDLKSQSGALLAPRATPVTRSLLLHLQDAGEPMPDRIRVLLTPPADNPVTDK